MSVAFPRESDEEHLEPRFELPIPPGPNLMTARGPALIAARIAELDARIAPSEEPEPLRRSLRYWQTRAATAEVVAPPTDGTIGIGSRVRFCLSGSERSFTIVGHDEADGEARIGYAAPLARAMMGLEEGDVADFQGRTDAIEILAVEPA